MPASLDPSEALTRATRIDSELRSAGWTTAGVDFEVEYQVGSKQDEDVGFLDYLLPDKDGRPLALVEAKRSSRDALAGKEQARLYADAIESRGGRRPLVFLANGLETWLWDHVSDPRRVSSFLNRDDLRRRQYQLENRVPLSSVEINASIVERDYQHAAIRAAHDAFEQGRRRVLWVMATGTGKTRAVTALIDTLMRASWAQRVLILTDRVALADQAAEALAEHLPNEPVGRITGSTYDTSRRLQVSTLQTMQDFHTSFGAGAFDLVITDECHRSIYNRWESVLARFDARLVGLTATPSDFLGRDTFTFFDCQDRRPTYGYELDEARVAPVPGTYHHLPLGAHLGKGSSAAVFCPRPDFEPVFHLFGALAQFKREIIRDRTVAGLAAARARGRVGGRPFKLSVEQRRQARKMYDARELTVEQIGAVLGVSRTSIYRSLGRTTGPAPPDPAAPTGAVEPADTAEAPVTALPTPAPATASGALPAGRARGRSRWFVVQADPESGPVAVLSGHSSQKAATAALGRARRRAWSGAGEGSVLQGRAAEQITSRLVWDPQAGRGVVQPGPPP